MNLVRFAALFGLLVASQSFAGTVFVGLDDAVGLDYDYQDLVFSLTSTSLRINAPGTWQVAPLLTSDPGSAGNVGQLHAPFWNQTSYDGFSSNIGFCIWGGGTCNNGVALDPGASYLAAASTSSTGSSNDVTFSTGEGVSTSVLLSLAGSPALIGWYKVGDEGTTHWLNSIAQPFVSLAFDPGGEFGLVAQSTATGNTFYSQVSAGGTADDVSHFAFFTNRTVIQGSQTTATPEPGSMFLALAGAFAMVGLNRRRLKPC